MFTRFNAFYFCASSKIKRNHMKNHMKNQILVLVCCIPFCSLQKMSKEDEELAYLMMSFRPFKWRNIAVNIPLSSLFYYKQFSLLLAKLEYQMWYSFRSYSEWKQWILGKLTCNVQSLFFLRRILSLVFSLSRLE